MILGPKATRTEYLACARTVPIANKPPDSDDEANPLKRWGPSSSWTFPLLNGDFAVVPLYSWQYRWSLEPFLNSPSNRENRVLVTFARPRAGPNNYSHSFSLTNWVGRFSTFCLRSLARTASLLLPSSEVWKSPKCRSVEPQACHSSKT